MYGMRKADFDAAVSFDVLVPRNGVVRRQRLANIGVSEYVFQAVNETCRFDQCTL